MLVAFVAVSDLLANHLAGPVSLDADHALAVLRIIGVNIVLSGDNAVVIALACRRLPHPQRLIGVILGAGVAVMLRIAFTFAVRRLLDVPWLKLAGGMILFFIAVRLLLRNEVEDDDIKSGANVWEALKIVAIADIVMSLDNVLAIAGAAGGDMNLIIVGLIISIPLVIFGSAILTWLMAHLPILVWAGAALLGWVAGNLLATDAVVAPHIGSIAAVLGVPAHALAAGIEALGAILVVLLARVLSAQAPQVAEVKRKAMRARPDDP